MPADAVLVASVPPNLIDLDSVVELLGKAYTIDEITDKYANDPNINIKFRMRPVTLVRTTYSKTNAGKYNKDKSKMFYDPDLGVSWSVFAVKQ